MTLSCTVGWRLPVAKPVPPSVTPWYSVTSSPISAVSPITTPIPWSMKKPVADQRRRDGSRCPVIDRATPAINRGSNGTPGLLQRVGEAVGEQRVDARPRDEDLERPDVASGRVAAACGGDVAADLGGSPRDQRKAEHDRERSEGPWRAPRRGAGQRSGAKNGVET